MDPNDTILRSGYWKFKNRFTITCSSLQLSWSAQVRLLLSSQHSPPVGLNGPEDPNIQRLQLVSAVCRQADELDVVLKGSVQRKLRPILLYIIQKLFTRRWTAKHLNFIFLKGQFTIFIKPLQRSCPSPITFAGKYNSTS